MWIIIAARYNNTFLTPRDYHLHFKHITHRRIATNNRFSDRSCICRFCHTYPETSMHLARCPSLKAIFGTLNKAIGFQPSKNRDVPQMALDTLFGYPYSDTPQSVGHLHMIAWRYIITDFYRLQYDETASPFDEVQAYSIYTRTMERYTWLAMAKAHNIRAVYTARKRKKGRSPTHPTDLSKGPT